MQYNKKGFIKARQRGYRSHLEEVVAKQIVKAQNKLRYENIKIQWIDFAIRSYTPDFVLDNGIIIEVKGFWATGDRRKHVEIQQQHSNLDIRLVFENSARKIRKGSKTSYGAWCEKKDIKYCDRVIPQEWLKEKLVFMPPELTNVGILIEPPIRK
jgi:hypothetical protein|tara:strand:+ start:8175 stop:8639 length:465 start_codon:yes stop_codon:yes gene_type:complete